MNIRSASEQHGVLVVVEGIDGAGKSSVVRRLAEICQTRGWAHVVSREPTNGPAGMRLRQSGQTGRLSLENELELFVEDRAEHVRTLIAPALAAGKVVILDRYYFSNAAYQGARGADPEAILARNEAFAPKPDLVLLLDLDPQAGRARIVGRGDAPDDFEEAQSLAEVRRIYSEIDRDFIVRIDAGQGAEDVGEKSAREFERVVEARSA